MHEVCLFFRIEKNRKFAPLVWLLLGGTFSALFEMAVVALVYPFIAIVGDPGALKSIPILNRLLSVADATADRAALAMLAGILVLTFLVKCAVQAWHLRRQAALLAGWQADLARRLFRGYLHAPYQHHLATHSAEMIRNVATLVRGAYGQFLLAFMGLVSDSVAALTIGALLLALSPLPALAAGGVLVVLVALQNRAFGRTFRRLGEESARFCFDEQLSLQQSLGAVKETRVLAREEFFDREFSDIQARLAGNAAAFEFTRKLPAVVNEAAMVTAVLAAVGTLLVLTDTAGQVLIGLGLLAAAAFRLMPITNRMLASINTIHHCRAGLTLLEAELARHPAAAARRPAAGRVITLKDRIELAAVSFRFPGAAHPAVDRLSVTIRRGETVGLVGPSGAGKSTLADILLGLLEPVDGCILIDGVAIGHGGARLSVGYVPQDILLFDDSIRRNVAFAIPEAEIDESRVREVLELVQLTAMVEALPNGLDTPLGENGRHLSGGQRQRIGIARALYHHPELLVLDEATSALDVQTEDTVAQAIHALRGSVTVVTIAHRLSTVRKCDRILLLHEGRLVDSGGFDELVARTPQFAQLAQLAGLGMPPSVAANTAEDALDHVEGAQDQAKP